ncbi:hypothetical protein RT717_25255 [Imperialibacter roseus]|uniref:Uncharacterized protein n=1 Tax=Imperialibacter roseus TaxID=1324217 RepID=A0ABZ0IPE9_9BACT|nr:hypothetical protein [Imperialibacter roseus]WOK06387.1 hypothetical protein RT717_25255 [Imperialibacter roseus]
MMKVLKIAGIVLFGLILLGAGAGWIASDPLPEGEEGPEAEALADKMLTAINDDRYQQIKTLSWTFPGGHHYVWHKPDNIVTVTWGDIEVEFSPDTFEGFATEKGNSLEGDELHDVIQTAWTYFANDSFWLVAPFKVRDPGTERRLVETAEGPGLLVTYTSGGVTPGDSYLWLLDENFKPSAWKLWVKVIPIGGVEISWENWQNYEGTWLASSRNAGFYQMEIKDIRVTY